MYQICRICCNTESQYIFQEKLLNHLVRYYECNICGYVQTETPYWLEEAYDSAINDCDTGIISRNQICSRRATNLCALLNIKNDYILDFAGGYGIFTRLMRDIGFNVLWQDKYCNNLFAKGFIFNGQNVKLLTAFEVFEHLESPANILDEMFDISSNIFFSTLLIPEPAPKIEEWWYYGQKHGQHIGFYRKKTLEYIANKYNKNLYSYRSEIHFFSEKKFPKIFFWALMKFNFLFFQEKEFLRKYGVIILKLRKKMKIKFDPSIFHHQKFGGISRYFFELSNEINSLNPHDDIKILAPLHKNEYIRKSKLTKGHYVEYPKYTNLFYRALNNSIDFFDEKLHTYDICHMTYYKSYVNHSRSKKVITVYDMIHEIFAENFPADDKTSNNKLISVNQCDHVICISEKTKADLINILNIPEEKISVTYLGVNSEEGLFLKKIDDYILYVGARGGYKNFENLIRAYSINSHIKNKIKIYVFGGGSFSKEETYLFKSLGISEQYIVHTGNDEMILDGLYKNALAFVYPSLYEGFGLPPLEAMVRKCPVAVSNASSIPEVVGNAGLYFNPNSIEDISHSLTRIIFDESLRLSLISNGIERAKQFTWTNCAIQTRKIYESLL